jgi:hypothetical protein
MDLKYYPITWLILTSKRSWGRYLGQSGDGTKRTYSLLTADHWTCLLPTEPQVAFLFYEFLSNKSNFSVSHHFTKKAVMKCHTNYMTAVAIPYASVR